MKDLEGRYIEQIEGIIEHFGTIQRDFVLHKNGIRAIVHFIQGFAGGQPSFSLDDPVILKGRHAVFKVIEELGHQLEELQRIHPPEKWTRFHETLVTSVSLQLDGHKEMARVFDDSDTCHIARGQELANRGLAMLEGGSRS